MASDFDAARLAASMPRWRGFNLLEKFSTDYENGPYRESDFDIIAELGFNFVRLPCSYWFWSGPDPSSWTSIDETLIAAHIDKAVQMARSRGIHVSINMHRIPGYCVNPPDEPLSLWADGAALDAAAHHWAFFAERYKGIPAAELSFDLVNEPPTLPTEAYLHVHRRLISAVREVDPARLIIAEGADWSTAPVPELAGDGVALSTRGYAPLELSHFRASWMEGSGRWDTPTWPLEVTGNGQQTAARELWDAERLQRDYIEPFSEMARLGVGVHVGEWGAYQAAPHHVVLRWMRDCLALWRGAGWGWALWNLRGSFGILDSERPDVRYEDFRGHRLDRKMLDVIQQG